MVNRNNRLKKAIKSLEKVMVEHIKKVEEEKKKPNYNYGLVEYWEKEIMTLTSEKKKKERLLKKGVNK